MTKAILWEFFSKIIESVKSIYAKNSLSIIEVYIYKIMFHLNMYSKGLDKVEEKIKKEKNPNIYLLAFGGLFSYLIKDYKRALKYFKEVEKITNSPYVQYFLAKIYEELSEYEKAIEKYELTLSNSDLKVRSYCQIIKIFYKMEKYSEAINIIDFIIDTVQGEDLQTLLNQKGLCLLKLGNIKEAKKNFKKALEISKDDLSIKQNLATSLLMLEDYRNAVNLFKEVYNKNKIDLTLLNNYTMALAGLGNYDEAIKLCEKGLKIDSQNTDLLINLGYCLYKKNMVNKAMECFKQAEKINPEDYTLQNNIAYCLISLKRFKEALEILNRILQKKEKDDILLNKAYCLFKMGQYKEAIECYEKISPERINFNIKTIIGICYERMGDEEKAVEIYNEALTA
ncbi:MAG: tetratricopeptide repeat protein [Thermovenabulum sp.]|uniref:tetratricopeptide repeat protein n=1 Tax=Thermovenabulum sp. TaxID=3100335 RepID=UPI003C7972CE